MRELNQSDVGKIFKNGYKEDYKILFVSSNKNITHPVIGIRLRDQYPHFFTIMGKYIIDSNEPGNMNLIIPPKLTINSKVRTRDGRLVRIICDDFSGKD